MIRNPFAAGKSEVVFSQENRGIVYQGWLLFVRSASHFRNKKANPFCTRLAFVFKKTNFSSTVSLGLEG
jgi:hypothetical protein